ncbi:MAG: DDE-type integrase/transposase/recombinase, partial [Thermoplasmata archaeon]
NDHGIHIPHNTIHRILLKNNLAYEDEKKKRPRKKWIRYERKHSLSLLHMDWHTSEYNGKQVLIIMDDSSRKILAGGEFNDAKQEHVISLMDNVLQEYSDLHEIREVLTDRGSQFYSNKRDKDNNAENAFEKFLEGNNIKHIISRINHPQTNGKVEKWFHLYEKYRKLFETFEDQVEWYNKVRYHESLDTDYYLQTPVEAFWSRLPEESKLGNFYKIMGVE